MISVQSAPLALTSCVRCGGPAANGASLCESCGRATSIPEATPCAVNKPDVVGTSAGRDVQVEMLAKHASSASSAMLCVAAIQTLVAVVVGALMLSKLSLLMGIALTGIPAFFLAIYFWSRKNPLSAAVCGLVIYIILVALDVATDPKSLLYGSLVKLIIMALLAKGVWAGLKHRELKRELKRESKRWMSQSNPA
jgi:hypothetical protein